MNELLEELDTDERVSDYNWKVLFSEGSLIGIFEIVSNNRWEKKHDN